MMGTFSKKVVPCLSYALSSVYMTLAQKFVVKAAPEVQLWFFLTCRFTRPVCLPWWGVSDQDARCRWQTGKPGVGVLEARKGAGLNAGSRDAMGT